MVVEIIPKSLIKDEDRPKSQLKTKRHKRKSEEEIGKALKKVKRVRAQREEVPKAWLPSKKRE